MVTLDPANAHQLNANYDIRLAHTFRLSRYAERICYARSELVDELRQHENTAISRIEMVAAIDSLERNFAADASAPPALALGLRLLRQRVMLRIIHRDLNELADLDEVVTAISALADVTLGAALKFHRAVIADKFKLSADLAKSEDASMVIVGMGKLGAHELNVSSDIDLIFIHAEDGEATPDRSWHEFHAELGKRVIRTIDEVTADGFVFRVDMRLRPYGASGALVTSLAALDAYFRTQARPWERYAWLKGRAITGATNTIARLNELVTQFVYRRYHDYAAIEEMRDIHGQIRQEATKRNRLNDIKVGHGGIREVEFIVQMIQLIRGGREPRLQIASTREALSVIEQLGLMEAARIAKISNAYIFLRNLEHRLQYVDDAQTQALPTSEAEQLRIAQAMNFPNWHTFLGVLKPHRDIVTTEFDAVFARTTDSISIIEPSEESGLEASIHAVFDDMPIAGAIQKSISERINTWRKSSRTQSLSPKLRSRLETLLPLALKASLPATPAA